MGKKIVQNLVILKGFELQPFNLGGLFYKKLTEISTKKKVLWNMTNPAQTNCKVLLFLSATPFVPTFIKIILFSIFVIFQHTFINNTNLH